MAKAMKSMALTDAQADLIAIPMPGMDKPQFPYGLRISLDDNQLATLGLSAGQLPKDAIVHLSGIARVTSNTSRDDESGKSARVELQFESMCCVDGDADGEEKSEPSTDRAEKRKKMYDRTE